MSTSGPRDHIQIYESLASWATASDPYAITTSALRSQVTHGDRDSACCSIVSGPGPPSLHNRGRHSCHCDCVYIKKSNWNSISASNLAANFDGRLTATSLLFVENCSAAADLQSCSTRCLCLSRTESRVIHGATISSISSDRGN